VVYQVAMALGVDDLTVIGAIISLLCWADGVTADGTIGKGGDVIIDRVCGMKGLSDALIDAGWLSKDAEGVVSFNEWDTHNGENAKKRALNVRKVVKCRANKTVTENGYKCNQKRLTSVDDALTESGQLDKNRIDKNNNTHMSIINGGNETFMSDDGAHGFLSAYGKKPRNTRAFRLAWAEALREVKDAATLTKAAELFIEHMMATEGSTRFLPTPEVWLQDCKYRDTIGKAREATRTVKAVEGLELPEGMVFDD
jgi:hypothetical protein